MPSWAVAQGLQLWATTVAVNDAEVKLAPWHSLVSVEATTITLSPSGGYKVSAAIESEVKGLYAKYPECLFASWIGNDGMLNLQSGTNKLVVQFDDAVHWQSSALGRRFSVRRDGAEIFAIRYHTFFRRLRQRPWSILTEIFMPDDDWGLVCDLPSFIHSNYKDLSLIREAIVKQAHLSASH